MKLRELAKMVVAAGLIFLAACDSDVKATLTPVAPTLQPTLVVAQDTPLEAHATATMGAVPTTKATATAEETATSELRVTPPPVVGNSGAVGCIATGAQAKPDSIGDPFYPDLGNAGYDAQHYTLDVDVDMKSNVISATTTMQARALEDLDRFNLDFEGFKIGSLSVNGVGAKYNRSGHELEITPSAKVTSGESFTVSVAYSGAPVAFTGAGSSIKLGWVRYEHGVYVASEPNGAAAWYPVNDHPCDKASYTFRITAPKPYVVAANGLLQNMIDNGDSRTFVWDTRYPAASYLVTVDIAEFDEQRLEGPDVVPVRSYFPRDLESSAKASFEKIPQMIEYFNTTFGPYPFEAYGVVVADTQLNFALETQTLSLFGHSSQATRVTSEEAVAHELVHQWFGDSVSLKTWKDIWLNEGFATYGQWLWIEHTQGRAALDERIRQMYAQVQQRNPPAPGNPPTNDLFNMGVYIRGGLTLHALRLQVGDNAFFDVLQTYASRYRYGNASTQDFVKVAEEVSGQKLGDFFDGWLYAKGMPGIPQMELGGGGR